MIKIHIPSGQVNGYFDSGKHQPSDWNRLLNAAVGPHFDGKTACAVSPGRHSVTRALQQLGDDLSKLGAADRAGVGHLRGEVFGDGAAGLTSGLPVVPPGALPGI